MDGSESKPTASNLDFNEIRRKSNLRIPKFDEKSTEIIQVRSQTTSPVLVENFNPISERMFEFIIDEQNLKPGKSENSSQWMKDSQAFKTDGHI